MNPERQGGPDLLIAGGVIVGATIWATAHVGPLGVVAGPAADLLVVQLVAGALKRPYRSPGAPLWALCLAISALLPAAVTWRAPATGLLLTATTALPAIVLAALGWRRPLAGAARLALPLAVVALTVSVSVAALHGAG